MALLNKEFFKSFESLSLYPDKSEEGIADELNTTPPGGSNEGDASSDDGTIPSEDTSGMGEMPDSNEQNNEFNASDMNSDTSGGMDGSDSGNTEMTLEPNENPFKVQNGKQLLDSMLEKLQSAVKDTISKIHASSAAGTVVISQFDALVENIDHVRETVFVLPKETSMVKYRMCVKLYNRLCETLCENIK